MRKLLYEGNSILIATQKEGGGPVIIQSSGYTADIKAATNENWFITQLRTVPHRDRINLPDPVIFKNNLKLYKELDVTVLKVYLSPRCKSLEDAANELADWYQKQTEEMTFIGHSKGGLLMAAALEKIKKPTKACLICPTFGTITGDETSMLERIEKCKSNTKSPFNRLKLNGLKKIIKVTGSRRPVDKDMCSNSGFIKKTEKNIQELKRHDVTLVTASCPAGRCSLTDSIFTKVGKIFGLNPKYSDGMVELKKQKIPALAVRRELNVEATHPTVLKSSYVELEVAKLLLK